MCRALVIQSAVLAEKMFTTFPLLQRCPFQPAHRWHLRNCLGWLERGRAIGTEMDQLPVLTGGTPEGQNPLIVSQDALAGGSNASEIREPFMCQSPCGGRGDSPREAPRGLWGAGGGSVGG